MGRTRVRSIADYEARVCGSTERGVSLSRCTGNRRDVHGLNPRNIPTPRLVRCLTIISQSTYGNGTKKADNGRYMYFTQVRFLVIMLNVALAAAHFYRCLPARPLPSPQELAIAAPLL